MQKRLGFNPLRGEASRKQESATRVGRNSNRPFKGSKCALRGIGPNIRGSCPTASNNSTRKSFTLSSSASNVAETVEPLDEVTAELGDEIIREIKERDE
jgi:hypothetical protein